MSSKINPLESKVSIIFDADDTLWETQILYDEAKEEFFTLMQQLGFNRETVRLQLGITDIDNFSLMGFAKQRFAKTLIDVYRVLNQQRNSESYPHVIDGLRHLGNTVFERQPMLKAAAKEVLSELSLRFHLFLYTAGDQAVQRDRVAKSGLADYFKKVYIVSRKEKEALSRILIEQQLALSRTWMVGNSLKSDINPALHIGVPCIWIKGGTWEYDEEPMLPGLVWEIQDLSEIPSIVLRTGEYATDRMKTVSQDKTR